MRLVLALVGLLACSTPPPEIPPPDGQILSPRIWDPSAPGSFVAGRLEIRQGRIRRVEGEAIEGIPTFEADMITLGFIDAHAHPIGLGRSLTELNLVGTPTYADALSLAKNQASRDGDGWVLGRGWDQNDWPDTPDGGWPLATDLDAFGERPIALRRVDGHATWANTPALFAAKIGPDTPDPPGGHIVRDASGQATGVLVDTASDLLPIPEPSVAQTMAWLEAAQRAMHQHGLVGTHDMGVNDTTLAAYRQLDEAGKLTGRFTLYLAPESQAAARLLREGPTRGEHLSVVGIKAYADGALGSRGAHLSGPYADDPSNTGLVITDRQALEALATRCLSVRAQLAVHAIGDQAVTDALDAFAAARKAVPDADEVPLRIEHSQIVRPEDRPRFAALNVIASVQPTHATSDMPWAQERLGEGRIGWAYSWRSLEEAGADLALGSDFPVEDVDPALGLHAAVHRTALNGSPQGGWFPAEGLTLTEAIAGFTSGAHRALGVGDGPKLNGSGSGDVTLWTHHHDAPEWRASAVFVGGQRVWP